VEEFPDTNLLFRSAPILPGTDWKDWVLLDKDHVAISKYAGVIKAVEFSLSLGDGYIAD
jgi:hypothetical protein